MSASLPASPTPARATPSATRQARARLSSPAPIVTLDDQRIVEQPLRQKRLVAGTRPYRALRWSPGAEWLAMVPRDDPGLDLLHLASGVTRTLGVDSYFQDAAFSPDGQEVLLPRRDGQRWSLHGFRLADGTRRTLLSDLPRVRQALWAADGSVIVATSSPLSSSGELRIRRADGSQQRLAIAALSYDLSPDGRTLAYTPVVHSFDQVTVRLADAATGADLGPLSEPGERLWSPHWSPDGRRLVASDAQGELVVIERDGGRRLRLGPGDAASWSPDGRALAFHGVAAGGERVGYGVFSVEVSGASPRRKMTRAEAAEIWYVQPAWAPDGRFIAFLDYDSGDVYLGELLPGVLDHLAAAPSRSPASGGQPRPAPGSATAPAPRAQFPAIPILIDPGHGGSDYGVAPGASRIPEKDLVLSIGLKLRDQLEAAGVPVAIIRTDDRYVAISQRVSFANALFFTPDNDPSAGRLLSIHLNSNLLHPQLTRVEIRVPFERPAAWPLGLALYQRIRAVTGGHYGFTEEGYPAGVHPADLAVTTRTFPLGYNLLTESLFLSNATQAAQVAEPAFQSRLARAHLLALQDALHK